MFIGVLQVLIGCLPLGHEKPAVQGPEQVDDCSPSCRGMNRLFSGVRGV